MKKMSGNRKLDGVGKISFAKVKYIGRVLFHNAECRGVDEDVSCLLLLASNFSKEPNAIYC